MATNNDKILIVDDSEEIRKQMKWAFTKDYSVQVARDRQEAVTMLKKHRPKVVTLDLGLPPDEDGTEEGFRCLAEILAQEPGAKVIVITGNEQRENALKAIHLGAYDFFQKPANLEELKILIKRAFHLSAIEEENRNLYTALERKTTQLGGMIGQCSSMQEVFSIIRKVATADAAVLLQADSGTGKELVARAIHAASLRSAHPFIPINCGAIPETLLESELFGHEKGAFTGAQAQVQGKFEFAHKGTLFLDEIGELPTLLQVKLLRFLQDKLIQRVGGREDISVDTRIIAATNKDLSKEIREGRFREDLFYRIGVVLIKIPPLRERSGDIVLLATYFLNRFGDLYGKRVRGFSAAALEHMQAYAWPGNVRELENKVQRAVILAEGALLEPRDLGFAEQPILVRSDEWEKLTLKDAKEKIERTMVVASIDRHKGNIAKAADELGISRPTLYDIMRKHGLYSAVQHNGEE
jgi:two-component system NtrC family response regulator